MNLRWTELAEECWDERIDGYHFDQEMFAKLIVKECGVALSPMLRDMVSRGQAFELIKQHFGVNDDE